MRPPGRVEGMTPLSRIVAGGALILLVACGSTVGPSQGPGAPIAGSGGASTGLDLATESSSTATTRSSVAQATTGEAPANGEGAGSSPGAAAEPGTPTQGHRTGAGADRPRQPGPSGRGDGAPRATGRNGVGIDDKTVKVGFVVAAGNPGAAFGIPVAYDADTNLRILRALVDELNDNGGLAGRRVEAVYEFNDTTNQDSQEQTSQQNAICASMTQDHKVFLVVSVTVNGQGFAYECYAKHGTPLIEGSLGFGVNQQRWDSVSPWLFAPVYMNLTRMARLLPDALAQRDFLTQKMGVVAYDLPSLRQSAGLLISELERRGGKVLDAVYMTPTYDGLGSGTANAVLRFKGLGIDRVVMWAPEGGALLLFANNAESQGYYPRYGVSTFDAPGLMARTLRARQLRGAVGVGFLQGRDLADSHAPPLNPRERRCFDVLEKRTDTRYTSRNQNSGAQFGLAACTLVWFTRDALATGAGVPLRNAEVGDHITALGSSYRPVITVGSEFGPRRLDGINHYRHLVYDESCTCFRHVGRWRRFQ